MSIYISILRGINVGGHNQIKMDVLRQLYAELDFVDIQTYIQSGNVVFRAEATDTQTVEAAIANKIFNTLGFAVPVLVLTIDKLRKAMESNPFSSDSNMEASFQHLTFLSATPDGDLLSKIASGNYSPDEYRCSGKTIYLYCPTGYGNTKLTNTFFEKKLKLTATTRNLRTANELMAMAERL